MPITSNRDLMLRARNSLQGKWGAAIGISVVYFLLSAVTGSSNFMRLVGLIVNGPLAVGLHVVFLSLVRNRELRFGQLFEGFSSFLNALAAYLLMLLFIVLWSLLLIVPGIVAACSYSMTMFIIADNPAIDGLEAIRRSKKMMYGNRWRLCCLGGRYTGWFLLGIVTCGIGFIWIGPYMMAGFAHFYQDLIDNGGATKPAGQPSEVIRQNP